MLARQLLKRRSVRAAVGLAAAAGLAVSAVVALDGQAVAAGNTNLVSNPSFEVAGVGSLTGWQSTANGTLASVAGGAIDAFSAKLTYSGASTGGAFALYSTVKPAKAIPLGEKFRSGGKVKVLSVTGKPICLQVLEQTTTTTVRTLSTCVTPTSTAWVSFPIGNFATKVAGSSLKIQVREASGLPGHAFQVDSISLADPDVTAPAVPTGLKATVNSATKVTVTWTAVPGAYGYRITRNHRTTPVGNVRGVTTFVDTTVTGGNKYSYQVQSYDFAGNTSAMSAVAVGVTPWAGPAVTESAWNMDDVAGSTQVADSLGSSPGTPQDIAFGQPGAKGTSFGFDGLSSQIVVPNAARLNPGANRLRIGIRLKTTSLPALGVDYDLLRKGTVAGAEYKMEMQPNGQASCTFSGSLDHQTVWAGPALNNGAWHLVECTKEDTTITLTVDGISWSKTVTIGDISNSNDLIIGAYPGFDFFKGNLDTAFYRVG